MERRLNFEGLISNFFLKAKQPYGQIGKILCPRFIKTVKKLIYRPYPAFRWNRIMAGATVSIKYYHLYGFLYL